MESSRLKSRYFWLYYLALMAAPASDSSLVDIDISDGFQRYFVRWNRSSATPASRGPSPLSEEYCFPPRVLQHVGGSFGKKVLPDAPTLGNVGRSFSLWLQRSRNGDAAGDTAQALYD